MKPIAIVHEDTGHKNLILALIEHLNNLENLNVDAQALVDFYPMGTKSNFFKSDRVEYKTLKGRINSDQIKKVLFILDADFKKDNAIYGGFSNTQTQLQQVLDKLAIEGVCEIFVLCNPNSEEGHLESLLLETFPEGKRKCIECFVQCSKIKPQSFYKTILYNLHKTAYPTESYYNFEHPHFDELKQKLRNLFMDCHND